MLRYDLVRNSKRVVWPRALGVLALLALLAWFLSRPAEVEIPWENKEPVPQPRGVYVFRVESGNPLQPEPMG